MRGGVRTRTICERTSGGWILKGTHRSCEIDGGRAQKREERAETWGEEEKRGETDKKNSEGGKNKQNDGWAKGRL